MTEASIVAALKSGFCDPVHYCDALLTYGGRQSHFFDRTLKAHVIVGYDLCQLIYRSRGEIGRNRFVLPESYLANGDDPSILGGYRLLQSMAIFQNVSTPYGSRRQRLLETLQAGRRGLTSGAIARLAAEHATRMVPGHLMDPFATSLRPYASQCASLAVFGEEKVPEQVTADALAVAVFLDGKRLSAADLLSALRAADRLGHWISNTYQIAREHDIELVADIVLLFVAAHESLAYLLFVCLCRIAQCTESSRTQDREGLRSLVDEAARYDSPVQMSGRVVLQDIAFGETTFRAGEKIYLHVGAANRDGRVFDHPHDFIENRTQPHLAFGWGPTRCVGAEFATACALDYLEALLSRYEGIHYDAHRTLFDHGLAARGIRAAFFTLK